MNNKIVVCLGKGGQRDMAESFARRTDAPIQDKPGDYLTVRFDSKGGIPIRIRTDVSGRFRGVYAAQSDKWKAAA